MSPARRYFRFVLYGLLALSVLFAGTAVTARVMARHDKDFLLEWAPTLFRIDIMQYQARAFFSGDEGKFAIANTLYRSWFSGAVYRRAGMEIYDDLAERGYAPAQFLKGSVLINGPPGRQAEGLALIRLAAAQNYQPAIERLALLDSLAPPEAKQ